MIKNYVDGTNIHLNLPNLSFHTMNLCSEYIIIYGGLSLKNEINGNFYSINTKGNDFKKISYSKKESNINNYHIDYPIPRFHHTANFDENRRKLFIFGGYNFHKDLLYLSDLNIVQLKVDPETNDTAIESESIKLKIPNRCRHTSFIYKNFLYIFGGEGHEDFVDKKGK